MKKFRKKTVKNHKIHKGNQTIGAKGKVVEVQPDWGETV